MEFSAFFPMWGQLTAQQQAALCGGAFSRKVGKGEVMHSGDADCTGLLLVQSGQLRAFMLSPEGREITLYRLFQRDLCLLSASCMMRMSFGVGSKEWLSMPAGITRDSSTWSPATWRTKS